MKVLLADDHALVREGIKYVLKRLDSEVTIYESGNHLETLALVDKQPDFDLILLDLDMPGMDGINAIQKIRNQLPCTPIIVVSASEQRSEMKKCLDCGANGYIQKSSTNDVMLSAVQLVLSGGIYLPPAILGVAQPAPVNHGQTAPGRDPDGNLTNRQREVLQLVAAGRTNKEIARELEISDKTVKTHITTILRTLSVTNRTQAVNLAFRLGLVEETAP